MTRILDLAAKLEGKSTKDIQAILEAAKQISVTPVADTAVFKEVKTPAESAPVQPVTGGSKAAAQLNVRMSEHGFKKEDASCEFKGSTSNQQIVKGAIFEKYGAEEVKKYRPAGNVCPRTEWNKRGYFVPEDIDPLCFITTYRYNQARRIALFHINQVVKG